MRRFALALILALSTGCASVRDVATLTFYAAQRKVLLTAYTPCGTVVYAWVRESSAYNRPKVIVCEADCSRCRMEIAPRAKPAH